jgi:hypothetical protein
MPPTDTPIVPLHKDDHLRVKRVAGIYNTFLTLLRTEECSADQQEQIAATLTLAVTNLD